MGNVHSFAPVNTTYAMVYVRPLCQILLMNVHTCVTDNTANTMCYVRSLYQIE
jgi:hypothetical protein